MKFPIKQEFKLTESFISKYKDIKPDFGFNGLGEFVYMRTYSRLKEDGTNESWWETVRRVVEGTYSIQKEFIEFNRLGWNSNKAQRSAQEMYDRIFTFKFLPPGRGLWAMGSPVIMERGLSSALYNCGFVSTENFKDDPSKPFCYAFDMLMLGVGIGFDTLGAGKVKVKKQDNVTLTYVVEDSREGWVESLRKLIMSFFDEEKYTFDYSLVRPAGLPIKTFGGVSSGPEPLIELNQTVEKILLNRVGDYLTQRDIVDIFNLIGKAVVSGNVRRSAELALGEPTDEFLNLKNYAINPDRASFGWSSNNSINAKVGMDYTTISDLISTNGEPGVIWLDNAKAYSRMKANEMDFKDHKIKGFNPCAEINLEDYELCNVVESFPTKHNSIEDYMITLKYAYLYAKTVTLLDSHWSETNRVMLRNRRIGISMTGITEFIASRGIKELEEWCEEGYKTVRKYDDIYSDWFAIPRSIKVTTVKPSGTVSLLAGVTPGVHFPESLFYIRRVRLSNLSPYIEILKNSGFKIEPAVGQENSTVVVEFPVRVAEGTRKQSDVTMWEQFSLAAFMQEHWSDNGVSVTITFDPKTESKDIANALDQFQFKLKAVSLLPKTEEGSYPQMPYQEITEDEYNRMVSTVSPVDFSSMFSTEAIGEKYCTNDSCTL